MTNSAPAKQNSRRYSFRIGAGLMGVAFVATLVLPCLSAFQIISVLQELTAYFWCFLGFIFGAYVFNRRGTELLIDRERIGGLVVTLCGLFALIYLWWNSDRIFTFWMMRAVPKTDWVQMASDLENLAAKKTTPEMQMPAYIKSDELPESIRSLGRLSECHSGAGYVGLPRFGDAKASVLYGYRSRTWGLYVGTEVNFPERAHFRRIRVAQNAFFFIGLND